MRALSIRQPYAELILRGVKTIEYRSWATKIIGERFFIYASKSYSSFVTGHLSGKEASRRIWSDDLCVTSPRVGGPPAWMLELAEELILGKLPRGVIVGSAVICRVEACLAHPSSAKRGDAGVDPTYAWHLADVERAKKLCKPTGHPQPSWFAPF